MGIHLKIALAVILSSFISVNPSPFDLTDAYVNKFKAGLEELKGLSRSYNYHQQDLIPAGDNETEIIAGEYLPKNSNKWPTLLYNPYTIIDVIFADPKEFDFIIVGSGASGAVAANRLSEVPEWNVLLLEAGAPETDITQVPAMKPYLQTTPYDWSYTSTPQEKSCLGMLYNEPSNHSLFP